MKHLFYTATLILTTLLSIAQVDTTKFREPANYPLAIQYYKNQLNSNKLSLRLNYQLACYNSLAANYDSAFIYLNKSIELGASAEDIITDTDFNSLHSDKRWYEVLNNLKARYLSGYKNITNPELSVVLWLLGIEDQRYRTLYKNYKLKEKAMETPEMWEKRISYVKDVVKKDGWPTISAVGEKAAESAFLVMQHANLNDIKKVLPLIIAAANNGEAKWSKAAMMIDRYISMTEGVQIYGTQFQSKGKKNKTTGKMEWSEMSYFPIADEENLDSRRNSVGLSTFDLYCKGFKVEYEKPNQRKDYKQIPIKKSWIKKGYIFGVAN